MRVLTAVLLALTLLFPPGCATLRGGGDAAATYEQHQLLFRAATQYATLKVIEKNPSYAARIAEIAGETADVLEQGVLMPLDAVEALVRGKIRWERLTPEEHLLVDSLIVSVWLELRAAEDHYIEARTMDPIGSEQKEVATRQALLYAASVCRWIEGAAKLKV